MVKSILEIVKVDLNLPPESRWPVSESSNAALSELSSYFLNDMSMDDEYLLSMGDKLTKGIPEEFLSEIKGMAVNSGVKTERLLAFNLYYDFTKMILGCTAFAVEKDASIFHARNLDWLSSNRALSRLTQITEFTNGPKGTFTTVGWPGSVGALSGLANGRFSVTLNAALSDDSGISDGIPVAFLIRKVLQYANDFQEAVDWLSLQRIPCDCLLLVCGVNKGEAVVIEKTPTRHALRWMKKNFIAVTNDYIALPISDHGFAISNDLSLTSCHRLDRIQELLNQSAPESANECLNHLSDAGVMMDITEQQMVFNAKLNTVRFEPVHSK